jgi:hypothetical protein
MRLTPIAVRAELRAEWRRGGYLAYKHALFTDTPKIGTTDQRRIAAVLINLGWTRESKDSEGKRWWSKA